MSLAKYRLPRILCIVAGVIALGIMTRVTYDSLNWLGKKFPGFMILENRVIPSISLPDWGDNSELYQTQVMAVDGITAVSAEQIYDYLAGRPVGAPVAFLVRDASDARRQVVRRVRVFDGGDYLLLFGTFLVNGLLFSSIGIGLVLMVPGRRAAYGVLSTCLCTGVFIITAVDLYGPPYAFFRLHAVSEAMAAASFIHLAAVFPVNRLGRRPGSRLAKIYLPFALLAIPYAILLDDAAAYTALHLIASGAFGIAAVGIIFSVFCELVFSRSALARRRIALVALGSLVGVLPLVMVWAMSSVVGGAIPLNLVSMSAFVFPLSIAFAVLKDDLFEIDVFLRRTVSYGVVMVAIGIVYFLVFFGYERFGPDKSPISHSPAVLALLNLGLLFLMAPIRSRAQSLIDRLFFRRTYLVEHGLASLSERLATVRTLGEVERHLRAVLDETLCPSEAWILRAQDATRFVAIGGAEIDVPPRVVSEVQQKLRVARCALVVSEEVFWRANRIEILLLLRTEDAELRLLALGPKLSGRTYDSYDLGFLETAANQIALAVANAAAFEKLGDLNRHLETLNEGLEAQVKTRTIELHDANENLNSSLDKLQLAYRELEVNQAVLVRADRLATLGRLTAGIAHEINTPLSAILNALKIIGDLAVEYDESVDDPAVNSDDHRAIAREILTTASSARQWGNRAAAYVSNVKQHGRESRTGSDERIVLREVADRAVELLSHRLRAAECRIEIVEATRDADAWGDAGRLGQVLVNLLANAIDAYEDNGLVQCAVRVILGRDADGAAIVEVADDAGGIAADVLPFIFDELYSTKEPGRGTGLGLWISRNIVEEGFGGTLTAVSAGGGSRFTARFPTRAIGAQPAAA